MWPSCSFVSDSRLDSGLGQVEPERQKSYGRFDSPKLVFFRALHSWEIIWLLHSSLRQSLHIMPFMLSLQTECPEPLLEPLPWLGPRKSAGVAPTSLTRLTPCTAYYFRSKHEAKSEVHSGWSTSHSNVVKVTPRPHQSTAITESSHFVFSCLLRLRRRWGFDKCLPTMGWEIKSTIGQNLSAQPLPHQARHPHRKTLSNRYFLVLRRGAHSNGLHPSSDGLQRPILIAP